MGSKAATAKPVLWPFLFPAHVPRPLQPSKLLSSSRASSSSGRDRKADKKAPAPEEPPTTPTPYPHPWQGDGVGGAPRPPSQRSWRGLWGCPRQHFLLHSARARQREEGVGPRGLGEEVLDPA